jgi:hypothetical protein
MINQKISKNKQAIVSMILLGLLMMTMVLTNAPSANAAVDTSGAPPGGGYEGPTTVPSGETADYTISDLAFLSFFHQIQSVLVKQHWLTVDYLPIVKQIHERLQSSHH